jgi:hypothetical protein
MSFKDFFASIGRFFRAKSRRRLLSLVLLGLFALGDFHFLGHVRRTFVFYSAADRSIIVEDRMLRRAESREGDMIRYVEEFLLGPVSPDLVPLFPRESRLESLLYRDDTAYVDLSESAVFPTPDQSAGGDIPGGSSPGGASSGVFGSFETLYRGIRRNFPFIRELRLFVNGSIAFEGRFEVPGASEIPDERH